VSAVACPVCRGRIALWVVQPAFTCHHCNWALRSNIKQARARAFAGAVLAEAALFVLLLIVLPSASQGLLAWLSVGFVLACCLGWLLLPQFTVLRAMRPPEPERSNPSFEPTATSTLRVLVFAAQLQR
jgi:hypothetical protein